MLVDKLLSLFNSGFQKETAIENITSFTKRWKGDSIIIPESRTLRQLLVAVPLRDKLKITVCIEFSDPVTLYSGASIDEFLTRLTAAQLGKDLEEEVSFEIAVEKACIDNSISVYSFNDFSEFLYTSNFDDILTAFSYILNNSCHTLQVLEDDFIPFQTKTVVFNNPHIQNNPTASSSTRNLKLAKVKTVTHFGGSSVFGFLPDDFDIVDRQMSYDKVNQVFDKLCLFYCIVSIFDIVNNDKDGFFFKINGYRTYQGNILYENLNCAFVSEYLDIYYWIYEGGNLSDKIGLARNIISIHIHNNDVLNLSGMPLYSIKSGYEIYLKQNIRQYIDIRNKVSDQLIDFNKRATTIVESFANGFQKNAFALITTFTSILAIKYLGSNEPSEVFTLNATIFCFVFICISILYLIISLFDVKSQKKRFIRSYVNLKDRFKDLLTIEDVQKILNNDRDFDEDVLYIEQKTKLYTIQWIVTITLIIIAVISFYASYSLVPVLSFAIKLMSI